MAPTVVEIHGVGGAGDGGEVDVIAAEGEAMSGIARMQREAGGHRLELLQDQAAVEANALRSGLDLGAGLLQDRQSLLGEEIHAELFQHPERGIVDALQGIGAQHLDRVIGVDDGTPGRLLEADAAIGRAIGAPTGALAPAEAGWGLAGRPIR